MSYYFLLDAEGRLHKLSQPDTIKGAKGVDENYTEDP